MVTTNIQKNLSFHYQCLPEFINSSNAFTKVSWEKAHINFFEKDISHGEGI